MIRSALVAGATGLVGREIVGQLVAAARLSEIRALVRSTQTGFEGYTRVTQCVTNYERLSEHADVFAVDAVFCALGTTIRKAGGQAAFRRVDLEYPIEIARLGLAAGAIHFLLVSALGADPGSSVFYNRVKGELEDALTELGFRSLTIARPSFLLGDRREPRPAEAVGRALGRLLPGRWRSVHSRHVAAALIESLERNEPGVRVIDNGELAARR